MSFCNEAPGGNADQVFFRRDQCSIFDAFEGPHSPESVASPKSHPGKSEMILEHAGDGIYGLDLHGYVTFVNPAARRLTGWSLEDLRGRTQHSMVHHSHADGSAYHRNDCPIYAALRDGRVHRRDDEVFWRKDGTCFPVIYTSTPIFHEGVPAGAVVIFSDITEQVSRRAWAELRIVLLTQLLRGAEPLQTLQQLCLGFSARHRGHTLSVHGAVSPHTLLAGNSNQRHVIEEGSIQNADGGALGRFVISGNVKPPSDEAFWTTVENAKQMVELCLTRM